GVIGRSSPPPEGGAMGLATRAPHTDEAKQGARTACRSGRCLPENLASLARTTSLGKQRGPRGRHRRRGGFSILFARRRLDVCLALAYDAPTRDRRTVRSLLSCCRQTGG